MLHLARFAIARPRTALAIWIAIAAVFIAIGSGINGKLSPSVTVIPGTGSSYAQELAEERFGPSSLVPILLQGPAAQLDIQGPKIVKDLSLRPDTRVMSAWSTGEVGEAMRPSAGEAMIVAAVARSEKDMVKTYQQQIDRVVDSTLTAPVRATITGQPTIDRALKDQALQDTRRGVAIAVGITFLVLLILLRSLLAAAVVAAVGATTAFVGFGLMAANGAMFPVDPAAVTLGSMAGLALGVGYSFMMVRAFREQETPAGGHVAAAHAAAKAVVTSGRATLIGGTALIISMLLAMFLSSIEFQFSVGVGVTACAAIGVGAAVAVLPAFFVLTGHRLDARPLAADGALNGAWQRLVGVGDRIVRRPMIVGAVATAGLIALAIPLLGTNTGPPNITMLPTSSEARQDFERISSVMGPGWATPYNVVLISEGRPLTSDVLLKEIQSLQQTFADDSRVESVLGPGAFVAQTTDLAKLPKGLNESARVAESSKKDLGRLEDGLGQAGAGANELRSGLRSAADGAGQLQGGSGQAQTGAGKLRDGLSQARAGAGKISDGLASALAGALKLRDGAAQALSGSKQLQSGLGRAETPLDAGVPALRQMATDASTVNQAVTSAQAQAGSAASQIAAASEKLQSLPGVQGDPAYQAAVSALASAKQSADNLAGALSGAASKAASVKGVSAVFADQTAQLADGVKQLLAGSTDLAAGIARLSKGNSDLSSGLKQLDAGGGDLTSGLGQLEAGASALEAGLGQLTSGAGELQTGLSGAVSPTGELAEGLGTMEAAVTKARKSVPSTEDLEKLKEQSPGLFNSGYFVLAAISGAPSADREAASFAVNLGAGGNAGQIVVVAKQAAHTQATMDLGQMLRDETRQFASKNNLEWAIGGPAGSMADFNEYGKGRIVLVVAGIALALMLLLMVALRAVLIPIASVLMNLLAAAATFGAMTLVFEGDDPLLGGPGYLDPMSIIGIFAVVFGLTAIYEAMLLIRTRERFVQTGDPEGALRVGLRATAAPATGASIAMLAVAVPFLFADLLSVRQFGFGVGMAILLDSFIVRPVLLPAAVAALGRRGWWPTRGGAVPPPTAPSEEPAVEFTRTHRWRRDKVAEPPVVAGAAPTEDGRS